MSDPEAPRKWNYCRRAVGVVVCLAPLGLPVASLWNGPPSSALLAKLFEFSTVPGLVFVFLGALVAVGNGHIALRPYFYRKRHGSLEGFRGASIGPFIGTFFALFGCYLAFGHRPTAVISLLVIMLDVGGLPQLLIWSWRESSFWGE